MYICAHVHVCGCDGYLCPYEGLSLLLLQSQHRAGAGRNACPGQEGGLRVPRLSLTSQACVSWAREHTASAGAFTQVWVHTYPHFGQNHLAWGQVCFDRSRPQVPDFMAWRRGDPGG